MQPSDLYVVHCSIEKDMVSRYIESFQLIPKAFGHQLNNPAATCRERIIGDMELIYYAGGWGLVTIDSVLYECHAGDLLLIPSYVPHSISTPPDDPHDNYWLHFDFPQLYRQQELVRLLAPSGSYRTNLGIQPDLLSIYTAMEQADCNHQSGRFLMIHGLMEQLFVLLLRHLHQEDVVLPDFPHDQGHALVDACMQYVYDNITSIHSVGQLCTRFHISESYLSKTFSRVLHTPPASFIRLVKIKYAEQLLKTTSLSINEISDTLGFSSPYHFSNLFKSYYRLSPKHFRDSIAATQQRDVLKSV